MYLNSKITVTVITKQQEGSLNCELRKAMQALKESNVSKVCIIPSTTQWSCTIILGKRSCKSSFHLGMGLKIVQNKEEIKEREKTTLHLQKVHSRCKVGFLRSFISALFLYFSDPSLSEITFY